VYEARNATGKWAVEHRVPAGDAARACGARGCESLAAGGDRRGGGGWPFRGDIREDVARTRKMYGVRRSFIWNLVAAGPSREAAEAEAIASGRSTFRFWLREASRLSRARPGPD
jgi:hypothetical protein